MSHAGNDPSAEAAPLPGEEAEWHPAEATDAWRQETLAQVEAWIAEEERVIAEIERWIEAAESGVFRLPTRP